MRRRDFYKLVLSTTLRLTFTVLNNVILFVLAVLGAVGISFALSPAYGGVVLAIVGLAALVEGAHRTWRDAMLQIPRRSHVRDGLAACWEKGRELQRELPSGRRFRSANEAAVETWVAQTRSWLTQNMDAAADAEFRMLPPLSRFAFILITESSQTQTRLEVYVRNLEKIIARSSVAG